MKENFSDAEHIIIEEFIKDLEKIANQVHELLQEIRDSKIDAATFKTELKLLVENVKQISQILRDGGDSESVLTRLALLEQIVDDVKEHISEDTKLTHEMHTRIALLEQQIFSKKDVLSKKPNMEKWKLYTVIVTGIFTLVGTVIVALIKAFG